MKRSVTVIAMALVCVLGFFGFNYLAREMDQPEGFDPYTISDAVEYTAGIPRDTVLFTVDGEPVTAEVYLYWAGYATEMMQYSQFEGGEIDWTAQVEEGKSLADSIKGQTLMAAQSYRLIETKANELGVGLTDEDLAQYETHLAQTIEDQGGDVGFDKWLLQVCLSREGYNTLNMSSFLFENLQEWAAPEADTLKTLAEEYAQANDLLRAKHILIMTVDQTTREPLSEEEQAAALAKAEDILAQLQASQDLETDFDRLMEEFSQDGGLEANPQGYTFTAGEMVAPFEQGTRALEIGGLSGLVKSDFGYHIILRLDPVTQDLADSLGQEQAQEKLDGLLTQWMEEAEVETTEAYDQLDIPTFYSNLQSLRAEVEAADQAATQPSESPEAQ